ncbi:MAG: hypothetical protein AB1782_04610, partial [Cyanobacteriota bacterium]
DFTSNKDEIINSRKKVRKWLYDEEYSIKYLINLLKRIKTEKYGEKQFLTDREMSEIAKQYNPSSIKYTQQPYFESFKEKLPIVRKWMK